MNNETYLIYQDTPKTYIISKFSDDKEADECYKVTKSRNGYSCDCKGFRFSKDKSQHKHCDLVDFWITNLDKEEGHALWFDGPDIDYNYIF